MKKRKWTEAAQTVAADTKSALETVMSALNQGQRQKLLKAPQIKALLERYGIE